MAERDPSLPPRTPQADQDITTVDGRKALTWDNEPYWRKLEPKRYVGYRVSDVAGAAGSWSARCFGIKPNGKRGNMTKSLGAFASYRDAKGAAEAWFELVALGGASKEARKITTVRGLCEAYADSMRRDHPQRAADYDVRFKAIVYSDPLAHTALRDLERPLFGAWVERQRNAEVQSRGNKERAGQTRSISSINRDLTRMRAAMNYGVNKGVIGNQAVFKAELKRLPMPKGEKVRRMGTLDKTQRQALILAAPHDFKPMLTLWCWLPYRCGAVARVKVENVHQRDGTMDIPDKIGWRNVRVPADLMKIVKEACAGKDEGDLVFTQADGTPWEDHDWAKRMRSLRAKLKLPRKTVAYTLRHSTITDMIDAGVAVTSVAEIAGTSVAMITKHYAHLLKAKHDEALAACGVVRQA